MDRENEGENMEAAETADGAVRAPASTASASTLPTAAAAIPLPPPQPPPPPSPPPPAPSSSSARGGDAGGQLNYPPLPPADVVVASRCGDVLTRATLLKSDHFPGCQNRRLRPLVEGAPNFRSVPGLPVFGVAIPTAAGLRRALEAAGAGPGGGRMGQEEGERQGEEEEEEGSGGGKAASASAAADSPSPQPKKVLWHNLREEPVIYINGRPFVVRDAAAPFANLEYTGIDRARVEDMEARLRADVLREAALCGSGAVLVAHEGPDFAVVEEWEPVTDADVQTPADVYRELVADGYDVDYLRVPVTDEKAPKEADFDLLLARCWRAPPGSLLFFNCQMGRGRTTTGMAIAAMVCLRKLAGSGPKLPRGIGGAGNSGGGGGSSTPLPAWFCAPRPPSSSSSAEQQQPPPPPPDAHLLAGRYAAVRSLLRALPGGASAKAALDAVLDASGAMQNLREAIAGYRARLAAEPDDDKRSDLLRVALEYLERYCVLIVFATYLAGPSADPDGGLVVVEAVSDGAGAGTGIPSSSSATNNAAAVDASLAPFRRPSPPAPSLDASTTATTTTTRRVPHEPFADWMRSRPELRSVLARMLRRNPLAALELHHHHQHPAAEGGAASSAAATGGGAAARRGGGGRSSARSAVSSPNGKESLGLPSSALQTEDEDEAAFSLDDDDAAASAALDAAAALVAARRGAVLGPQTILKEDHYPGCQAPRLRAAAAAVAAAGAGGDAGGAAAAEGPAAAAAAAAAGGVAPVRGAPNFRRVPGDAHVYGGGTPTEEGVRGVLSAVIEAEEAERKAKEATKERKGSSSSGGGGGGGGDDDELDEDSSLLPPLPVLWVNLREEVCLYVNGRPYVLREAERPFKNMREYVGISPRRLEAMEARLKADVLREASESLSSSDPAASSSPPLVPGESSGGARRTAAVLVAREEEPAGEEEESASASSPAPPPSSFAASGNNSGGVGTVVDTWEPVAGPRAVATPREIYEAAAAEFGAEAAQRGGNGDSRRTRRRPIALRYVRLPLTDGAAPRPVALDALLAVISGVPPDSPIVVTCQMGGGRTTTGMAIACLARAVLFGRGSGKEPAAAAAAAAAATATAAVALAREPSLLHLSDNAAAAAPTLLGLPASSSGIGESLPTGAGPEGASDDEEWEDGGSSTRGGGGAARRAAPASTPAPAVAVPPLALSAPGSGSLGQEIGQQRGPRWGGVIDGLSPRVGDHLTLSAGGGMGGGSLAATEDEEALTPTLLPRGGRSASSSGAGGFPRDSAAEAAAAAEEKDEAGALLELEPPSGAASTYGDDPDIPGGASQHASSLAARAVAATSSSPSEALVADAAAANVDATAAALAAASLEDELDGELEGGSKPPADPLEAAALAEADYEGVRKFTRVLDDGERAKALADAAVDAAGGAVVNLRAAIARWRRPRRTFRFYRPEINARHAAFTRGLTYLERYCLLIVLASYLRERKAAEDKRAEKEKDGCQGDGGGEEGRVDLPAPVPPFSAWLAARPDVRAAADAIRANPAGALMPVRRAPVLQQQLAAAEASAEADEASAAAAAAAAAEVAAAASSSTSRLEPPLLRPSPPPPPLPPALADGAPATADEVRRVLSARQGGTLNRRSILKSYVPASTSSSTSSSSPRPPFLTSLAPSGTSSAAASASASFPLDVRRVAGVPLATVGSPSFESLRSLLDELGAGPLSAEEEEEEEMRADFGDDDDDDDSIDDDDDGGASDSNEAGKRAKRRPNRKPRTLVVLTDLREELVAYVRGTPYSRRELDQPAAALHHAGVAAPRLEALEARLVGDLQAEAAAWGGRVLLHCEVAPAAFGSAGAGAGAVAGASSSSRSSAAAFPSSSTARPPPPRVPTPPLAIGARPNEAAKEANEAEKEEEKDVPPPLLLEDVTVEVDATPAAAVRAFWARPGPAGDAALGLSTPRGIASALRGLGYAVRYARVPLSRERTPQAADLDALRAQVARGERAAAARGDGRAPFHVVVSRTATGSSARFAAVLLAGALSPMMAVATASSAGDARGGGASSSSSSFASLTAAALGAGAGGAGGAAAAAAAAAAASRARAGGWSSSGADTPDLSGSSPSQGASWLSSSPPLQPRWALAAHVGGSGSGGGSSFSSLVGSPPGGAGGGILPPSAGLLSPPRLRSGGGPAGAGAGAGAARQQQHPFAPPLLPPPRALSEYRSILNLVRALPRGRAAKAAADAAIDACGPAVGDLRDDILRCKAVAEGIGSGSVGGGGGGGGSGSRRGSGAAAAPLPPAAATTTAAARRLGLHYLQRYFFLIAFFSYRADTSGAAHAGNAASAASSAASAAAAAAAAAERNNNNNINTNTNDNDEENDGFPSFAEWCADRRELRHLLSTLSFEQV